MENPNITPIDEAVRSKFEFSTRAELIEYCNQLGIEGFAENDELPTLKNLLFQALGIDHRAVTGSSTGRSIPKVFRSPLIPSVNLTPSGRWGGRRRRVMVPRPAAATKSERAMPIGWNGKATYWLPFGEPIDIPWPIYQRLLQKRIRRPVQKKVPGPDGSQEITTAWEFDTFHFTDMGDTPGTSELPTSMTEWYQDKGPNFFRKLSDRDLVTVASRLDIGVIGQDKKRMSGPEILDLICVFLFGLSSDSIEEAAREDASAETTTA